MTDCAGIGWVLYDKQENIILKGMASIPPTSTPEEAEAEALRSALFQVGRLGYTNVLFCGDASNLYHNIAALESNESLPKGTTTNNDLASYIQDIKNLAKTYISSQFCKIPRTLNNVADKLAKIARSKKMTYVISWTDVS
jgi:ribonuclease HI